MEDDWTANLTPLELPPWAEDLRPMVEGEVDLDDATQDKHKGLDCDLSYLSGPRTRTFMDLQHVKAARDHIRRLPEDGESIHGVVSGRYPLFALVPAILELASPAIILDLDLVTLSYGKDNAADLLELLDDGRIGRVRIMVSHYFAAANAHLYEPLEAELASRGQKMLALRTHAKIILARLSDGRSYVCESSANLRSCKNIEQFCFTRDMGLWAFHHKWVGQIFEEVSHART